MTERGGTFGWTSALKGLVAIFLRARARGSRGDESALLAGGKGSPAASLDDAIYKGPQWLADIFGVNAQGEALVRRVLSRINPGRKRGAEVSFHLNQGFLSPQDISIYIDGLETEDPEVLEALASEVSLSDSPSRSWGFAPNGSVSARKSVPSTVDTIHFICPSDGAGPFYGRVLQRLIHCCSNAGGFPRRVVPILPPHNFAPYHLWRTVDEIIDGTLNSAGVILIPDEPDMHVERIAMLQRSERCPVVLFDVDVERASSFNFAMPPFVGGNETRGGMLAGEAAGMYLSAIGLQAPRVLVIRGASTAWEVQRSDSFVQVLRSAIPSAQINQTPQLSYDRAAARRFTLDEFGERGGPECSYDFIFACNDDMALGAKAALCRLEAQGLKIPPHFKIMGYDGVREMIELIESQDRFLLGTIDVSLDRQVDRAFEVLQMLTLGERVSEERHLVEPALVLSSSAGVFKGGVAR